MAPKGTQVIDGQYRPGEDASSTLTNSAPISSAGVLSTNKNIAGSSVLVANDSNADAITYSIVTAASFGVVSITNPATGAYTYTPNNNFSGVDTFTFKARDAALDSNVSTVTVTVNNSATAPVAVALTPASFNEDIESGFISLSYSDVNNDLATSCTLTNLIGVTETTLCACDGAGLCRVKVKGVANHNGASSFSYYVEAGGETSNTVSATFSITPINDTPTLTAVSTLTGATEDTSFTITYAALAAAADEADVDGDALSFRVEAVSTGTLTKSGVSVVPGTTLLSTGQSLVWTPAANANGVLNAFTITAYDGTSVSAAPIQVQVSVAAVIDQPTLTRNNTLTLKAATTATITAASYLAVADADNTASDLVFSVGSAPTHGTLRKSGVTLNASDTFTQADIDANSVTYVHTTITDATLDSFTFTVSDGSGGSIASTTFNITPVVAPQTLTRTSPALTPGNATSVSVKASGGSVTSGRVVKFYTGNICSGAQHGSDAIANGSNEATGTGTLSGDAAYTFYATVTVNAVVSACSPVAGAANYVLDTGVPTAPTAIARLTPSGATGSNATPTLRLSGGDAGSLGVTAKIYNESTCSTLAGTGSISSADVTLSTITSGAHTYYAKLTDEAGNDSVCSTANVSYTLNTTPTISNVADSSTNEDTATSAIAVTVGDTETAAGSLTLTATSSNQTVVPNANITLGGSGANRTITITPAANQNGTATITLTIDDGFSTATDTFVLTVNAVNDAPTLTTINTLTGATVDTAFTISYATLAAAANEADIDSGTINFRVEAVSTGTLTKGGSAVSAGVTTLASGESLVWTPASAATGTLNAFTVKAYDGALASATAIQVQVTVSNALDLIDDDNDNTGGFGAGAKVGVAWNTNTTNKLILAPDTDCDGDMTEGETTYSNCSEIDSSWTPQWSSLISYWKMNNSWADSKGTSTGTSNNGATFTTSRKLGSHAGIFDGVDDYLTATLPSAPSKTSISVSLWFKTTTSLDTKIFGFSSGDQLLTTSGGNLRYCVGSCDATTTLINDGIWHHAVFTSDTTSMKVYLDGKLALTGGLLAGVFTTDVVIGKYGAGASNYYPGTLDDVAIWSNTLTAAEVETIYSRQSAKYSGQITSRVIDYGSSNGWDGLKWLTNLPFGKELPDAGQSESSINDYPLLVGSTESTSDNNLMSGIAGLWHLNGTVGLLSDNESVPDKSGLGTPNNAEAMDSDSTNTIAYGPGKFNQAMYFDGANDYLLATTMGTFGSSMGSGFSSSFWIKTTSTANISVLGTVNTTTKTSLLVRTNVGATGAIQVFLRDESNRTLRGYAGVVNDGVWHHVVATANTTSRVIGIWVDGVSLTANQTGSSGTISGFADFTYPLTIGALGGSSISSYFAGSLDEVAIWNRVLTNEEIRQLYRRGANRIKFQYRTCIDVACNCKSYGASGSTTDCDGDATINASDTSDAHFATWIGSDNTSGTYFSELHNKDLYDSSANCSLSNLVLPGSPDLLFSCFTPALSVTNQYFQYRSILESDDVTTTGCNYGAGATWCSPELRAVEVAP